MDLLILGPLGQSQGNEWKEVGRNVISHIFVFFDERSVTSISFGFVVNNTLVLSKSYGKSKSGTSSVRIVRLNHESEFITGLSGEWTGDFITNLTFHTNQKAYEAYRSTSVFKDKKIERREFHSGIRDRCEFGGFYGSFSSDRLLTIGLLIKPVIPGVNTVKREAQ